MAKARIMVVEDEWIIANDIKDCLIDMGYAISDIVASGEEAISKTKDKTPDLVLMDIVLQGELDGIETAKIIQDKYKIPIIYLTANDNQYLVDNAKETDHYGYLLKPFSEKELRIAIDLALHKYARKSK